MVFDESVMTVPQQRSDFNPCVTGINGWNSVFVCETVAHIAFLNESKGRIEAMQNVSRKSAGSVSSGDIPRLLGVPFASGVTLIYLLIGSLWLFFSDRLMLFIAGTPRQLLFLSTGKGWFYVLLTALLIYWCLDRFTRQIRRNQQRMREYAERHLTTLQAIGDAVLSTNAEGCIEIMNPVAELLTGWTAEAACGRPLDDVLRIIDEETREPVALNFRRAADACSGGGPARSMLLIAHDGAELPVAVSVSPIRDVAGSVSGMVLVFRDQRAARDADAALRESDLALRRAQRLAHIGSWVFDLNNGTVYASDEARRIYGLDGDSWPIDEIQKIPLVTYREMLDKALADLIRNSKPYDVECQIRRLSDKEVRYIHSVAEYEPDRRRVIGTIHDITERKLSEAARQESEFRYIELFEHAVDGILVGTPEGRVSDANSSALRLLGVDKETLCGRHISSLFSESQLQEVPLDFARLQKGETVVRERQYVRPDGKVLYIEMHSKQMPDGGYQSIFRDVTDRKRDEIERESLQAQLMQVRKIESVGRLAGGVAHDFNNMLGVIMGYAEMAINKLTPGDALRGDLDEIMNAARRSAEMTSQLLAFARKQPIRPHVLDLNKTVDGILNMLRRLIGEHIDLAWCPASNVWPVRMDRSQVEQIMTNLCLNARDAISGSGRIAIETDMVILTQVDCARQPGIAPGCYVKMTVADNGCGMDKDLLDSVFEPFFTTKDTGKGTGLGLATVYGIVKQNRGYIHVSSTPGEGTCFNIYLLRCDGTPDADPPEQQEHPLVSNADETILVAEDEPGILNLSEVGLSGLGYNVLTATSPEAAIEIAKQYAGRIHLLLSDVVMPGMNGKDLATAVRSYCPAIKVLYMSGYTARVIAQHGVLAPGTHFLQKPFTMRTLATKVRETLDVDAPQD